MVVKKISELTEDEIKKELTKRGIDTSGEKSDLFVRLRKILVDEAMRKKLQLAAPKSNNGNISTPSADAITAVVTPASSSAEFHNPIAVSISQASNVIENNQPKIPDIVKDTIDEHKDAEASKINSPVVMESSKQKVVSETTFIEAPIVVDNSVAAVSSEISKNITPSTDMVAPIPNKSELKIQPPTAQIKSVATDLEVAKQSPSIAPANTFKANLGDIKTISSKTFKVIKANLDDKKVVSLPVSTDTTDKTILSDQGKQSNVIIFKDKPMVKTALKTKSAAKTLDEVRSFDAKMVDDKPEYQETAEVKPVDVVLDIKATNAPMLDIKMSEQTMDETKSDLKFTVINKFNVEKPLNTNSNNKPTLDSSTIIVNKEKVENTQNKLENKLDVSPAGIKKKIADKTKSTSLSVNLRSGDSVADNNGAAAGDAPTLPNDVTLKTATATNVSKTINKGNKQFAALKMETATVQVEKLKDANFSSQNIITRQGANSLAQNSVAQHSIGEIPLATPQDKLDSVTQASHTLDTAKTITTAITKNPVAVANKKPISAKVAIPPVKEIKVIKPGNIKTPGSLTAAPKADSKLNTQPVDANNDSEAKASVTSIKSQVPPTENVAEPVLEIFDISVNVFAMEDAIQKETEVINDGKTIGLVPTADESEFENQQVKKKKVPTATLR